MPNRVSFERAKQEREEKAEALKGARDWTPIEALETALELAKAGKLNPAMLYIAMRTPTDENGRTTLEYVAAGGSQLELVGLLTAHSHMLTGPAQ